VNKIFLFIFLIFIATGCATKTIDKERCKDIYDYFTKAKDCLALKFESSNPKKYKKYKDTHILILEALTNQVYENKIDNNQAWTIYEDVILEFTKSKNKTEYLENVLDKYN
jgi:hypothetical protein